MYGGLDYAGNILSDLWKYEIPYASHEYLGSSQPGN
jgi:hypothetical protein